MKTNLKMILIDGEEDRAQSIMDVVKKNSCSKYFYLIFQKIFQLSSAYESYYTLHLHYGYSQTALLWS